MFNKTDALSSLLEIQAIDMALGALLKKQGDLPKHIERLEAEQIQLLDRIHHHKELIQKEEARIEAYQEESKKVHLLIKEYREAIEASTDANEKEQMQEVLDIQELDTQLIRKRIRKTQELISTEKSNISALKDEIKNNKHLLADYKKRLKEVKQENKTQLEEYTQKKEALSADFPDNDLLKRYERIRAQLKPALIKIVDEACGGCFIKVPLQQQIEVRNRKRVVSCGHCARIFTGIIETEPKEKKKRAKKNS